MKVSIITLHKVLNYGSALQAYATQEYLKDTFGADVELVDYKFPNAFHRANRKKKTTIKKVEIQLGLFRRYLTEKRYRMDKRFQQFWDTYFQLTPQFYTTVQSVISNPPIADLYITGSDQVWNTNSLCNDPIMYCRYAPEGSKKISFGASFTNKSLPDKYRTDVRKWLSEYTAIGVREQSSLDILQDLNLDSNIELFNTCDPTLLLSAKDYHKLAEDSIVRIDYEYIFVYFLSYAYHPEPAISNVIKALVKEFGYKVVVLCDKKIQYQGPFKQVYGIGPCEFAYLFEHAKFVVTSSFHGTMFSIINRIPFITILPQEGKEDRRSADFLRVVGLEDRGVKADAKKIDIPLCNPYTNDVESKIISYINKSKQFLGRVITAK